MRLRAFDGQPLFLVGMMGAGKSTVGPLVAAKLRRRFVDLDAVIEHDAGATVREVWDAEGEEEFRKREAAALAKVASEGAQVIALGGGAPCFGDNAEVLAR